ncbi:MAG: hypothetical protein IPL63_16305 [Saprospiraceae bacterium]|nr:hypothetical protein [Saprospiraceae bacterium]MBK6564783.1 hypothetical protein [Saprospiraceae bacterium]MBK6782920.1 hypothetical protein [Saprospiraceae bacterium]MBK7523426.1 hypothetical protein [Saprospiraceae bacterium]MBK8079523.1 hypothetical protein [Saprospiraceae bacterium]
MYFREILCQTNDGQIELSCCGQYYKISFHHMVMRYNEQEFVTLSRAMKECYEEVRNDKNRKGKLIVFSTPVESMKLRFSIEDIEQFQYLLETSYLLMEEEKMQVQ